MKADGPIVRISLDTPLAPSDAFEIVVDEIVLTLGRRGLIFEAKMNGRISDGKIVVGQVVDWRPPVSLRVEWHQAEWEPDQVSKVGLRFEPVDHGTRIALNYESSILDEREYLGWFASEVLSSFLQLIDPNHFGDWFTDRRARRPSGAQARETYRDPTHHRPNFLAILEELKLTKDDYLVEIGCGGGAFLKDALKSGCRATAIDHSADMVRLARSVNADAIKEGRLEVVESEADKLPLPNSQFSCAVMTGVFGFLPDPLQVLKEIYRVLSRNGHLVVFTGSRELRGTPAAPEPMASRIRFYEDEELESLAENAGFVEARVKHPNLRRFAEELGFLQGDLQFFSEVGRGGQLLVARKPT